MRLWKPVKMARIMRELFRNPRCITRIIDEEELKKEYVSKKYGLPNGLPTLDILDLFPNLSETVEPYSFLDGTSMITDLALLKALARRYETCRYLEIGTWRGESIANVASVAEQCTSISLSADEMNKLRYPKNFIKVHRIFSQGCRNIQYYHQNSRTFDFLTLKGQFDLVFVDGDHSYGGVKVDTQNAFKVLKDSSSVIVWHDYGFSPETVRWSVLAGILDGAPEDTRNHLYHVSNTMCAIYLLGEYRTEFVLFPAMPDKKFSVKVSVSRI